jgi:hypothetical protein
MHVLDAVSQQELNVYLLDRIVPQFAFDLGKCVSLWYLA